MVISDFSFSPIPRILFGVGKFRECAEIVRSFSDSAVLVTGGKSLQDSGLLDQLLVSMREQSIKCLHYSITGEPSPEMIDSIVGELAGRRVDVVIAVGGGSVLDAGKAISAMLGKGRSILDFLEGVGTESHDGTKVPFIAVPTTSGTGSEATKNAVLSQVGPDGFKKSLRHDNLVPNIAVIAPELSLGCPFVVTAACGMDAFTQLLESYVSSQASVMTDGLAFSAMGAVKEHLVDVCSEGAGDVQARAGMAYASLVSGITLANAGLGVVHGLASSIGGAYNIPHGVICGTLIGAATKMNIQLLRDSGNSALDKYVQVGRLFAGDDKLGPEQSCDVLVDIIDEWTEKLKIPRLSEYGMNIFDLDTIIDKTSNKNNPVQLDSEQIKTILLERV